MLRESLGCLALFLPEDANLCEWNALETTALLSRPRVPVWSDDHLS